MMKRGTMFMVLAGAMLSSGCASDPAVEVRAIATPGRAVAGADQLALGHAAFAMGNVGLALQQFRQSLRDHPSSTDALSAIALCYDAMGRTDLSRRYYEEALALAPADTRLLQMYASALARQGAAAEAQAVVSEIALRSRKSAVQWVIEPASPASDVVAMTAAPAAPASPPIAVAANRAPAAVMAVRALKVAPPKARLERLSLGEIALVTTGAPLWTTLPAATPLRSVRLLNAARRQGLAARNRKQLHGAGWRSVAIGDAPHTRTSSLVLYPVGQRGEARRLADNLRIAAIRGEARRDILILLGRDLGG